MPSNTSSLHSPASRSQLAADIRAAGDVLRGLVAELQPKDVPLVWAPDVLVAFAEVQRVAESGRILMTARAAAAGQWERERFASAGDWLAAQQGTTTGRARADLETSERLDGLDATADAVRAGLLSPEQAGAVSDAAVVNPVAEDDLLDLAQRDSLRRTQREADRRKAEAQSEADKAERDRRVRRERSVRFWYANGAGHLSATGPVGDLKALEQLIQRDVDRRFRANRAPATREPRAAYAFDALTDMGASAANPAKPTKAPLTRMTLVRVDLGALMRGHVQTGEMCEIGGIAVSVAELRRLLGDSIVQLVLTNGEAVIDVVNLNRKPSVAQMVAKLFVDSTCTAQGCDRAARLEFDHRNDWASAHVTELHNLDLLCDHHHDLKTHHNWQLVTNGNGSGTGTTTGTGRRPMVPPTDPQHPNASRAAPPSGADDTAPAVPATAATPAEPRNRLPDLAARLVRLRHREAQHQARLAGQNQLFDTG